ncbi:MAG: hypothetical protein JWN06_1508 [Propionibacteriaceae bacterium]|jgi:putative ABC transport system permease protein|nr:hypothetical protein [Propionibacteriaceae bacterium]
MTRTWLLGLLRRRPGRLAGIIAGIGLAVALLGALGGFLVAAQSTMTGRATRTVAVDWQVQVAESADPAAVLQTTRNAAGTVAALPVSRLAVPSLSATTKGTQQRTSTAVVLGLPDSYQATFPGQIRILAGMPGGVMVAQQTAANLHVAPGDSVQVALDGHRQANLRVASIVELPQANSLFQRVGATSQAQPVAPPDNVLLVPQAVFDKQIASGSTQSTGISYQIHTTRSHRLPATPAAAYVLETGAARNLEVALAGAGTVGDNLGAALDAARGDAAYAQILFLFLGAPGAILAGLITAAVAASGTGRRRREQALLRTRGTDQTQVVRLAAAEAVVVGLAGGIVGLGVAALVTAFGPTASTGFTGGAAHYVPWFVSAAAIGIVIALLSLVLPVRSDLRSSTVMRARSESLAPSRSPWFIRYYIDLLLIAVALLVLYFTSQNKYDLVLAPEGVATISVSYWALAAPLLLWIGGAGLIWRLVDLLLHHGHAALATLFRPLAGRMSSIVMSGISRRRRQLTWAVVLLALATSFAVSTATFNTTYQAQAEVDARLTTGSDIAVNQTPGAKLPAAAGRQIASVAGVASVEPLLHRFAYVGSDLQDIYGVRPGTVGAATRLQDSYFSGGTANELMNALSQRPDGVLVSQETVTDYQLKAGDHLKLRLQDSRTHSYREIPFTYIGIATEFPTAPKDSFLVANQDYLAQQTRDGSIGTYLVDTGGQNTAGITQQLRSLLGTGANITDLSTVRGQIGTSLTSVNLKGLTAVELTAAIGLAIAASGLVLGLGLNERRRSSAIAAMLGVRGKELAGFITSEAAILLLGGVGAGLLLGAALSQTLVRVLTGVFDPPPAALTLPWSYLVVLVAAITAATAISALSFLRWARHAPVSTLREA